MRVLEDYKRNLVSPEDAVKVVKSGDRVTIPYGAEPRTLEQALARRREELRDVEIFAAVPRTDFGWFQPGWEDSFPINVQLLVGAAARELLDERRADYTPFLFTHQTRALDERKSDTRGTDVVFLVVSPPDRHGFCSFGASLWNKRTYAQRAKTVVAEVDPRLIRTFGSNFIHISEIDCMTESNYPEEPIQPPYYHLNGVTASIAHFVGELIRDGDTIQIGGGRTSAALVLAKALDGKNDLGWHSELTPPGVMRLAKAGVITGNHKTLHPRKLVAASFECAGYIEGDEAAFVGGNPLCELYDVEYVVDIRTIAANDNMVAINNALAVDLTGQITVETMFGTRLWNGPGGQLECVIGSLMSKGGRSVTVLPSTGLGGAVSRIVPRLEEGSVVTIPRTFADHVVTEYGVARLMGKSLRRRAEELIAVAHPDFRAELRKAAAKLFYP